LPCFRSPIQQNQTLAGRLALMTVTDLQLPGSNFSIF
jgi:hypothetical protein